MNINKYLLILIIIILSVLPAIAQFTKTIQDINGIRQVNYTIDPQYFTQKEVEIGINEQQMRDNYTSAINDLNTIINTTNPTNAQVVWAIKRLAEIEKQELRFHKKDIDP